MSPFLRRPQLACLRMTMVGLPALVAIACGGASQKSPVAPTSAPIVATASAIPSPQVASNAPRNLTVDFITPLRGWLGRGRGTEGEILTTDDGGTSWAPQYQGEVTPQLMQFVDTAHGWMAGCIFATASSGRCDSLLSTQDGGSAWVPTAWVQNWEPVGLAFVSPTDGWVLAALCGAFYCKDAPAQLFGTSDGGVTWSELPLPASAKSPLSVQRLDADVAWVVTQGSILITRDSGLNWTKVDNPCGLVHPNYGDFYGGPLDFADSVHGWIGCTSRNAGGGMAAKTLYRTNDGGLTWRSIAETQTATIHTQGVGELSWGGSFTDLHFFNASTGWLAFDGPQSFLYQSDDGGRSWNPVDDGVGGGIAHLFFTDSAHGWAWGGVLINTTDAGAHWQKVDTPP